MQVVGYFDALYFSNHRSKRMLLWIIFTNDGLDSDNESESKGGGRCQDLGQVKTCFNGVC